MGIGRVLKLLMRERLVAWRGLLRRIKEREGRVNIIFFHGLYGKNGAFYEISKKIPKEYGIKEARGYIDKEEVEISAKRVADWIIREKMEKVILVGHSKGGLITSELIKGKYGVSKKIKKIINFSTPYQGSIISLLPLRGMKDLELSKTERVYENEGKIVNIYPRIDNRIWPRESLRLKGAENIEIDTLGHASILEDERAMKVLLEKIKI